MEPGNHYQYLKSKNVFWTAAGTGTLNLKQIEMMTCNAK